MNATIETVMPHVGQLRDGIQTSRIAEGEAGKGRFVYPLPPMSFDRYADDMDIYVRFMRHLRVTPHSREDIRILSAIGFVADMTGQGDADITVTLIEMGLRAPRSALPASYLIMISQRLLRGDGGLSAAALSLVNHWHKIEDPSPVCCAAALPRA